MGTEKFIAFKEDGTAYRLKGRILRFLDNEPVSEDDKTNIRSTLSVPASAEGLTPANNLSDLDSAATARTNLSVNSKDEDAQANALKTTAPSMYFNGTSSNVVIAADPKLVPTDGTNDTAFSGACWVKADDLTTCPLFGIYGTSAAARNYRFNVDGSDKLTLLLIDTGGHSAFAVSNTAVTAYDGKWVHFAFTYGGSDSGSFGSAANQIALYINGSAVAVTPTNDNGGTYDGMTDGTNPLWIGRFDNSYKKSHIRDCKIFNRSLTASEVAELARGNDLGFSEEWAGAHGGVYTSDFTSDSVDSFTATGGAVDATTSVGGEGDNIQLTVNTATSSHYLQSANLGLVFGKRYRVTFDYYLPSSNSNMLGIRLNDGSNGTAFYVNDSATQDAWTRVSAEGVIISTTLTGYLQFRGRGGGSNTFTDAGGDDTLAIRNVTVTEIGTLADFRAEDYNESANKLLDRSSNNFVGVGTSVTLTGNQRHISADTIDLKNLPTSSAGLSAGEVWSNGGVLTVV